MVGFGLTCNATGPFGCPRTDPSTKSGVGHAPTGRAGWPHLNKSGVSIDALTVLSAVPASGCFQPSRIRSTTITPDKTTQIIVGVDTHTDTHAAVAINQLGRRLGTIQIRADESAYQSLLEWANQLGEPS